MFTNEQIILARLNNICPVCVGLDNQGYCPESRGKHGRGSWIEGDALHNLKEKLGSKPYIGKHGRGRHAA